MRTRYVRPETVSTGDTIRVHLQDGDMVVERVGTVSRWHYEGSDRVATTQNGKELLRWNPHYKGPKVTLLKRPTTDDATLF